MEKKRTLANDGVLVRQDGQTRGTVRLGVEKAGNNKPGPTKNMRPAGPPPAPKKNK